VLLMPIEETSFLSAADREALTEINRQGFSTLTLMFPSQAGSIALGRWDSTTEDWVAVDAQDVRVVIRHERRAQSTTVGDVSAVIVDGEMFFPDPADVVPGDRFTWERGEGSSKRLHPAIIVTVEPVKLGLVKTYWRWDSEGLPDGQ
jgi:hypothetical protein